MGTYDADVLVVGLGPAGSRAAARAAGMGCSVIALERRRRPGQPVQCAEFVPPLLGQDLDGLAPLTTQSIRAMTTFVEAEPPDLKSDFPGLMIDRRRFDEGLAAAAAAAGALCRLEACVESVTADGLLRLGSGERCRAKVLIGADGPRSRVGRAVGRVNREVVETRQVSVPLRAPQTTTDIFLSADYVGGYSWLFPKGAHANLGVGLASEAKSRLKPLLNRLHESLVEAGRVGPERIGCTGGPIPVGGLLAPVARLGETLVLLAGDAAGLANPVTGAGIASAVISGDLAGEAAADWLAGERSAPEDYAAELEDLFKPALDRAMARRRELLARYDNGAAPGPAQLRRSWIAYPDYWAA
jgi:geranylgeranyl reductase family protein